MIHGDIDKEKELKRLIESMDGDSELNQLNRDLNLSNPIISHEINISKDKSKRFDKREKLRIRNPRFSKRLKKDLDIIESNRKNSDYLKSRINPFSY